MSFYQTLLSVAVEHSYHTSGVCSSLVFNTAANTASLFRKTGLICRPIPGGIQIIYDRGNSEALQMYALDPQEPLSFDFTVSSSDPEFKGYTEPYTGIGDEVLYFDNRATGGSGEQTLSVSEFVSVKDVRSPSSSDFKDILRPTGRMLPPEFVLRIFANNAKGSLLNTWLKQPPTEYSIKFRSRQRYWKYYLLGKTARNNKAGNKFYIVDPDNKVEFESTGQEILSNQNLAYTFRSKQQISLYEQYSYRFQLKQKSEIGESTVISGLPLPGVQQVGMDAIAEQDVLVSEIYINS